MVDVDFAKMQEIFLAALECYRPEELADYLDQACGSDTELRRQVKLLLKAHHEAGSVPGAAPGEKDETGDHRKSADRAGTVIGPYKLLQQIGQGGMGTVYMAEQTEPVRRKVALKIINPGMDSRQVMARFEAERQALALMDHPNIAKVLDAGTTGGAGVPPAPVAGGTPAPPSGSPAPQGRPYFVMELVKGVPITKYCDDNRLTPRERLQLFVPVCQAIQHAHQKGIIHRDIKPSNVMVCIYDGKPVPKVIDFGVAKATGPKLTDKTLFTEFGAIVGTVEYMSPEQAQLDQLDIDTRSDIYSLGVVLYELLAGSPPFSRRELEWSGMLEILQVIREQEPSKPSTKLSTSEGLPTLAANRGTEPAKLTKLVRGELDWIVMKALEKDRSRRYETGNDFALDIQRYLADEPVLASPPSVAYRFRKFVRRHKGGFALAGMMLFCTALVGAGTGWITRDRAAREQEIAQERSTREAALDDQVNRILDEASSLIESSKWQDALAAVQRAEKLLTAAGRLQPPSRLRELQNDLACAQRLEDIFSRPKTEEFFSGLEPDEQYATAFASEGIDVTALPVAELANLIRARSIYRELARALDIWSFMRQRCRSKQSSDWTQLSEIAEAVDPDPWRNRLRQARRNGDHKALADMATAAKLDHLPPDTILLLAHALYESGGKQQAMDLLRQACLHYPENWWLNNSLGWWCLTASPPQCEEAIRYYTASLAARPRNAYNVYAIGKALTMKGAHAEAIATLTRAIEMNPMIWGIWSERGWAYRHLHQLENSIADLSKAIELDPKNPVPWSCRGLVHSDLHERDKALADINQAIALNPKYEWAWHDRGWVYAYQQPHQYREAIADFTEAIKLNPGIAITWNDRGWTYGQLNQFERALGDLTKAIELDPKCAVAWSNRSWVHRELRLWEKALADVHRAIELNPQHAEHRRNRGDLYSDLHQYDKAQADYAKASEFDPQYALCWHQQAWLLATCSDARLRDAASAVRLARKAVELSPDDARYRRTLGAGPVPRGGRASSSRGLGEVNGAEPGRRCLRLVHPSNGTMATR